MTTPLNDNAGYVSVLGAGLTVTAPQTDSTCCSKDQAFVIKVQHGEDIRRLTVPELSWDALLKRIAEAFKLPEAKIALKYKDEEGDLVTIQSTEELLDAHSLSLQQRSLLRLYAFVGKRKQVPHPTAAPSAASTAALPLQLADPFAELKCPDLDLKVQKKALKEEKKALKEERKALYRQRKEEHKEKKKVAKAELKSNIEGLREQVQAPFDPAKGSWREQRRGLCEQLRKEKEELKRCKREMKIEQRIAHREARRQARTEGGEGRNRIIARFVKHVTIPDGTHLEPGQKFVKTWRMRNEGEQAWTDCKIVFVSKRNGDQMGAPETVVIPTPVSPQSEVDVSVEMVAPDQPGRYVGFWRLVAADGRKFGQRVWVKIDVVCSSSSSDDDKEKEKEPIPSTSFDNLEAEVEQSFFDIKEERDAFIEPKQGRDLEAASSISAPVKPTIAALLKQLKDLGFSEDVGRNIMLLKKHDGDLDKVIAELLA